MILFVFFLNDSQKQKPNMPSNIRVNLRCPIHSKIPHVAKPLKKNFKKKLVDWPHELQLKYSNLIINITTKFRIFFYLFYNL